MTLREYLIEELEIEEIDNLLEISKFVRTNTKLSNEEKCNCVICNACNIANYPQDKKAKNIYTHHLMKVEYLSILADRYNLVVKQKHKFGKNKKAYEEKIYGYKDGFELYSPRVGVCEKHHSMFHELCGDKSFELVKDINLDEAKKFLEVFNKFDDEIKKMYVEEHDIKNDETKNNIDEEEDNDLKNYKESYKNIWNEVMMKSIIRLGTIININTYKKNKDNKFDEENSLDDYKEFCSKIDERISYFENDLKSNDEKSKAGFSIYKLYYSQEVYKQGELEDIVESIIDYKNNEDEKIENNNDNKLDDKDEEDNVIEEIINDIDDIDDIEL